MDPIKTATNFLLPVYVQYVLVYLILRMELLITLLHDGKETYEINEGIHLRCRKQTPNPRWALMWKFDSRFVRDNKVIGYFSLLLFFALSACKSL